MRKKKDEERGTLKMRLRDERYQRDPSIQKLEMMVK